VSIISVGDRVNCFGEGPGMVVGIVPGSGDIQVWLDSGEAMQFSKFGLGKLRLSKEKTMVKDDDVVTATAGRIRSAAGKCPQANQVLREVYPEVFKEEVKFQVGDIVGISMNGDDRMAVILSVIGGSVVSLEIFGQAVLSKNGRCYAATESLKLILRPNLNCTPRA
jgi:hypothetical protein